MNRFTWALVITMSLLGPMLQHASPAKAEASAAQIFATDTCSSQSSTLNLSWLGVDPAATEISLDLSYFDNGFAPSTFRNSGALAPTTTTAVWSGLPTDTTVFIRLNQAGTDVKSSSRTYFFTTCRTLEITQGSSSVAVSRPTTVPTLNVDCRVQTCLTDPSPGANVIIVPSLEYCIRTPVDCPPRYFYEPTTGSLMVYPNIPPRVMPGVFINGQFYPHVGNTQTVGPVLCLDGLYSYAVLPGTCAYHGNQLP
jgi:hypothetical protein